MRIHVAILEAAIEGDHDVHLVVALPKHRSRTMITEFPDAHCKGAASSYRKAKIAAARSALFQDCGTIPWGRFVKLKGTATLVGVGFFDDTHGQPGWLRTASSSTRSSPTWATARRRDPAGEGKSFGEDPVAFVSVG